MHPLPLLLLATGLAACGAAPDDEDAVKKSMKPELADTYLGLEDGGLRRCPDMPNCVCSQHPDDRAHYIEPFPAPDADAAWDRLVAILKDTRRVEIRVDERPYLHARFTTAILRFQDDVEFLLDEDAGVVHVRSASRLGYSDLGKNQKRVEALRARFIRK